MMVLGEPSQCDVMEGISANLFVTVPYRYPPDVAFYIFFSTTIGTEYFKHAAHSPFFSSKCRLFHNATFFGSCIIHIQVC